jgi:acyl carrier protein
MTQSANTLKIIIADALRIPVTAVHDHMTMENTEAWDSLSHMQLIISLERFFAISLTPDEMIDLISVERIQKQLQARGLWA